MSQRTPSAWSPIAASVSTVAARRSSLKALSWTTSGHGAKYGSRPRVHLPARLQEGLGCAGQVVWRPDQAVPGACGSRKEWRLGAT
ncbi:hypothetical protein HEP87_57495 [Streptomyces sp. S1D4-11]